MTTPALTLHHVATGPAASVGGEPLVFIHALGCDLRVWEDVATAFVARHRVVRYDLRGHGRSDCGPPECTIDDHVRDLIGLLDRLAMPSATLVGISVGGLIALAAALRHPARVRRLVICASAARIGTRESWTERMTLVRERGLERMADAIVSRWVTPGFAAREPAVVRDLRSRLVRTPVEGYIATCATLRDTDLRAEANRLRAPALVLGGEHDQAVPAALARELADTLPAARWQLVTGCAHLPPIERPAVVSAALARFLAE
jgi:3-oxoadipate enol-lactonase